MTGPYTAREQALASDLHAVFVGADLAKRLPLSCLTPWHQRQWCAVARLAIARLGEPEPDLVVLGEAGVVPISPPDEIGIPPVPMPALAGLFGRRQIPKGVI
jgi:hypothetical protein